jgi:hypothetical protein
MKFKQLALLLLPAWACAYTEAEYESGDVHQMIMNRKEVCTCSSRIMDTY